MKLNFGCSNKIFSDYINVDIKKPADKVFDFNVFPYPFKDNTFDFVLAIDILEHLEKPEEVMRELHRICKNNAIIRIKVPYYNSHSAYNGIEHIHFFNETTIYSILFPYSYYTFYDKGIKYGLLDTLPKFSIIKLEFVSTKLGKLIYPKKVRKIMSYVLGEIFSDIEVDVNVNKKRTL